MIGRLLREPLLYFLILAGLIFAVDSLIAGKSTTNNEIRVSQAKIEQLASLFAKTWQRAPTTGELKGLIDDYVVEEAYVREAMHLGLDRDDTVIRRRLRMKMAFLNDAEAVAEPASDATLQSYLEANPDLFRQPLRISFEQVYVNAQRRGNEAEAEADALLTALRKNAVAATEAGDPTMLPSSMTLSDRSGISRDFGDEFAAAVVDLPVGDWQGPIRSSMGIHLVRMTERLPGRLPPLSEVRDRVEREWTMSRREDLARKKIDELLSRYKVTIEPL